MNEMETIECKECGKKFENVGSLRRHVKCHGITFEFYTLKWKYNSIRPLCKCGCGKETNWNVGFADYNDHVHGHHAFGRKKSVEEKAKIGKKNSENMIRYLKANPEIAKLKNKQLRSGITEESEARRITSVRETYNNMTLDDKKKFSEHSKRLWQSGIMQEARILAAKTFLERSANGEYDFKTRNENVSKSITQMYIDNPYVWSKGNVDTIKGGNCHYRSSWEKMLYEILDANDDVISYKSEPFFIRYEFEGTSHRYIPDLLIQFVDKTVLCEVKPISMRSTDKNIAKREAALKYCSENGYEYIEWSPEELVQSP